MTYPKEFAVSELFDWLYEQILKIMQKCKKSRLLDTPKRSLSILVILASSSSEPQRQKGVLKKKKMSGCDNLIS
ncbi:3887_t:CDS:2 [Entrophospora sp. SA101]|nr:3887_t:CDS:2 [Entrophospora sp. SA101]CAJ0823992.1 11059_t:CDS:2 [Entrophospora sp. SA101]